MGRAHNYLVHMADYRNFEIYAILCKIMEWSKKNDFILCYSSKNLVFLNVHFKYRENTRPNRCIHVYCLSALLSFQLVRDYRCLLEKRNFSNRLLMINILIYCHEHAWLLGTQKKLIIKFSVDISRFKLALEDNFSISSFFCQTAYTCR